MNTIEGNKLIAEFMGLTPVQIFGRYSVSKHHCTCNDTTAEKALFGFAEIAKYHESWDWLMPVVEKIESLNITDDEGVDYSFDVTISYGDCTIQDEDTTRKALHIYQHGIDGNKIQGVWLAVVEFIKWYNGNTGKVL